jgi:hypothetical protein
MKLTLTDLDKAFDDLWLHTEQLPALLEKWQEMVSEYIAGVEPTEVILRNLEERMDFWQKVLEENRNLFEAHQDSLKDSIKTGEPDVNKIQRSKKYEQ